MGQFQAVRQRFEIVDSLLNGLRLSPHAGGSKYRSHKILLVMTTHELPAPQVIATHRARHYPTDQLL